MTERNINPAMLYNGLFIAFGVLLLPHYFDGTGSWGRGKVNTSLQRSLMGFRFLSVGATSILGVPDLNEHIISCHNYLFNPLKCNVKVPASDLSRLFLTLKGTRSNAVVFIRQSPRAIQLKPVSSGKKAWAHYDLFLENYRLLVSVH